METSGEVADLVVKESIQVAEAAAKLAGKGAINLTAFLAALAKENYKVVGKAKIQRIAKEGVPAVVIQVKREDFKTFAQRAKQYGVLYSTVVKRGEVTPMIDVISNQNYAAQINAVMESMGYPIPEKAREDTDAKKARPLRAPRERSSPERKSGLNPPQTERTSEKPSTRGRLQALQKAAKELERQQPVREKTKVR